MTHLTPKQMSLLSILLRLNAWEQKCITSLQTQEGRAQYFQRAAALLAADGLGLGLAPESLSGMAVGLTSEAFVEDLSKHLDHALGLLENHFLMVEK